MDFPIEHGDFPVRYVAVYQRVAISFQGTWQVESYGFFDMVSASTEKAVQRKGRKLDLKTLGEKSTGKQMGLVPEF